MAGKYSPNAVKFAVTVNPVDSAVHLGRPGKKLSLWSQSGRKALLGRAGDLVIHMAQCLRPWVFYECVLTAGMSVHIINSL